MKEACLDTSRTKRLSEIRNEFERGVFLVLYQSPKQKLHRSIAVAVLVIKHALRGILFSWPLYLLTLAAFAVPAASKLLFIMLLAPALYVSWLILSRGVREDYENLVDGSILRSGYQGRILLHKRP